jgi:hypothetical protein
LGNQKIKAIIAFTLIIILFMVIPNKSVPKSFWEHGHLRTIAINENQLQNPQSGE